MSRLTKSCLLAGAAAVAATGFAGAAMAQSQWDGPYVGVAAGKSSGAFNQYDTDYGSFNSTNGEVFMGFNKSSGNLVFGAEVSTFLKEVETDSSYSLKNLTDFKFKVGTTFGKSLVYATAGYSVGTSSEGYSSYEAKGMNYGIGMDYSVTDNMFVGASIVARNLESNSYLDTRPMTTASIRVGFKF